MQGGACLVAGWALLRRLGASKHVHGDALHQPDARGAKVLVTALLHPAIRVAVFGANPNLVAARKNWILGISQVAAHIALCDVAANHRLPMRAPNHPLRAVRCRQFRAHQLDEMFSPFCFFLKKAWGPKTLGSVSSRCAREQTHCMRYTPLRAPDRGSRRGRRLCSRRRTLRRRMLMSRSGSLPVHTRTLS